MESTFCSRMSYELAVDGRMPLIQLFLIFAVLALLAFFLRHHGSTRAAAGFKVGFVLFLAFCLVAVLFPQTLSYFANIVGVGRGTDLLLYAMVVAFSFNAINSYLRFKEVDLRYARLVRAIAMRDATKPSNSTPGPERPDD